jgi:hypothetical protein
VNLTPPIVESARSIPYGVHKFARNYSISIFYIILYRPDQGDIVRREYIISSKFMYPIRYTSR